MHDVIEPLAPGPGVDRLLAACDLHGAATTASASLELAGVVEAGEPIAAVGLEIHGQAGLLRSLAVAPSARGRGLAARLVGHAEERARARGVSSLFLLTETAAPLFERLGYAAVPRSTAPAALRATAQFATLCPAGATCMHKALAHPLDAHAGGVPR